MTDSGVSSGAISKWIARHPKWSAFLCGLLVASGFPPLSLWPLGLVGVAGLLWLTGRAPSPASAAWRGWLFGFAMFAVSNSWMAKAFTYQANMPSVLGWFASPLLALYFACYPALAAGAARWLVGAAAPGGKPSRQSWHIAVALAGCWVVAEWLRGWVLTGFAWNPLGILLLGPWDRAGIAAILPWLGSYALGAVVILLAGGFLYAFARRHWWQAGIGALAVLALMYWPAPDLEPAPALKAGENALDGPLQVTLVQPDLQQDQLGNPALFEAQFQNAARLSQRIAPGRRIVLWPESGLPDYLRDGYPPIYYAGSTAGGDPRFARRRLAQMIGPESLLMTGATDLEFENGALLGAHNGVTVIDADGELAASYYKSHLVPFGEYVPLRSVLEPLGMSRFVQGIGDFLPGNGPETFDFGPYGKAGIQICYEIIFPGVVTDRNQRPDYIFNPSNDGWYGAWGPPQHVAQARLRAIEEGLPVLRSTTTGISAVIDAHGVVRGHIGMNKAGRIDMAVPPALAPTWFARLGNALSLIWAGLLLAIAVVARWRRRG